MSSLRIFHDNSGLDFVPPLCIGVIMSEHHFGVMIPLDNVKLKNDNISFIILSVDNFSNSLLILSYPVALFFFR